MPYAAQRWLVLLGMVLLALLLYYAIVASSPNRYSIYKVLKGVPAPANQLAAPKVRPEVTGPKLKPSDVPSLATLNEEYKRIIQHVLPSLVTVETEGKEQKQVGVQIVPNENAPQPQEGTISRFDPENMQLVPRYSIFEVSDIGSGIFVSANGHVITNNHLVLGAARIYVTTADRKRYEAEVIGADLQADIAILRLVDTERNNFPVLNFADSDKVRVGDMVLALGNPFGLTGSVTQGVISGTNRRFEGIGSGSFFQTDAEIYPGNSGGPLVNIFGEIIGINVLVYSGRAGRGLSPGVSLALPSNQTIETYEYIMSQGRRARAFLGVLFNPLSEEKAKELGTDSGVLISQVLPSSPAEASGLKDEDVVLAIAGQNVDKVDPLLDIIRDWDARKAMPIAISRDGEIKQLDVWLGEISDVNQMGVLPSPLGSEGSVEHLEASLKIELHELSQREIRDIGLPPDLGGIVVRVLLEESPLNGYFLPFDVIHHINGKPIWTKSDFYEALAAVSTVEKTTIVLTREDRRYYLELRPN